MDSGLIHRVFEFIGRFSAVAYAVALSSTVVSVVRTLKSARGRAADFQEILQQIVQRLEDENLKREDEIVRLQEELKKLSLKREEVFTVNPPASALTVRITRIVADLANVEFKSLS